MDLFITLTQCRTGFNIIPAYSKYFGLTTVTKSVLSGCYFVGSTFACLVFGMIANKIGRKKSIIISAFIKLTGIVLMAAAQNFGMFLAGRIILGFGSGASGTTTPT